MDVGWGEDGAMAGAHRTWYHLLSRGTRRKEGLADLGLAICEIGSGTPASVVERAGVKVLCVLKLICQHSLLLLPHPLALPIVAYMSTVPFVPFLAASGGTLPSGDFFLCYFLMELEVALKPAQLYRGREVKAVQGM